MLGNLKHSYRELVVVDTLLRIADKILIKLTFDHIQNQKFTFATGQKAERCNGLKRTLWFDCGRALLNYTKTCCAQKAFTPYEKMTVFFSFSLSELRPFFFECLSLFKWFFFKK